MKPKKLLIIYFILAFTVQLDLKEKVLKAKYNDGDCFKF